MWRDQTRSLQTITAPRFRSRTNSSPCGESELLRDGPSVVGPSEMAMDSILPAADETLDSGRKLCRPEPSDRHRDGRPHDPSRLDSWHSRSTDRSSHNSSRSCATLPVARSACLGSCLGSKTWFSKKPPAPAHRSAWRIPRNLWGPPGASPGSGTGPGGTRDSEESRSHGQAL